MEGRGIERPDVLGHVTGVDSSHRGSQSFFYDADGNLQTSETNSRHLTFDDLGFVTQGVVGNDRWSYRYNIFGQLLKAKNQFDRKTAFEYDGICCLVRKVDDGNVTEQGSGPAQTYFRCAVQLR